MRIIILTEEESLHFGIEPLSLMNPEGLEKFFIKSFQEKDFVEIDSEEYCIVLGDLDVARLLARFGYNVYIAEVNGKDVGRLQDVSFAFIPYATLKEAFFKVKLQSKQRKKKTDVFEEVESSEEEMPDEAES